MEHNDLPNVEKTVSVAPRYGGEGFKRRHGIGSMGVSRYVPRGVGVGVVVGDGGTKTAKKVSEG